MRKLFRKFLILMILLVGFSTIGLKANDFEECGEEYPCGLWMKKCPIDGSCVWIWESCPFITE